VVTKKYRKRKAWWGKSEKWKIGRDRVNWKKPKPQKGRVGIAGRHGERRCMRIAGGNLVPFVGAWEKNKERGTAKMTSGIGKNCDRGENAGD